MTGASSRRRWTRGAALLVLVTALTGCSGGSNRDTAATAAAAPATRSGSPRSTAAAAPPRSTEPSPSLSRAQSVALPVPHLQQLPELKNGCEVTSLAMLLAAVGHPVDKLALVARMPVDPTPVTFRPGGTGLLDVQRWGDPRSGFVGNVHSYIGYGIYAPALLRLLDQQLPRRGVNLTGQPFDAVLEHIAAGTPVLAWTTTTFRPTTTWVTWQSPTGPVRATPYEHAVVVSGYDSTHLLIADPLSDDPVTTVDRTAFEQAWQQLGQQAITVAS